MQKPMFIALPGGREHSWATAHVFVGAAVILEGTFLGDFVPALVTRIHGSHEKVTGKGKVKLPWDGENPLIDAIAVKAVMNKTGEVIGEPYHIKSIAHDADVVRNIDREGLPKSVLKMSPRYVIVKTLGAQ